MILTKQLEPRDSKMAPHATPRGNLARELEKYSRPEISSIQGPEVKIEPKQEPDKSALTSHSQLTCHAPDRPNILSRRPHMRHKPNMLSRPRFGPTVNRILSSAASVRSLSPSSQTSTSSSSSSSVSSVNAAQDEHPQPAGSG